MAEIPGRESEAMAYVEEAIEIAGEQSFLLDTKGIILTHAGEAAQAVEVLRQATSGRVVDPRFYLHLAIASDQVGAADDARQALENALAGGLESTILTDSDKKALGELRQKLLSVE
jgi:Flp pilus assembly protein TadD